MNELKNLTIKLPKDWVEHLEQLEKKTSKDINYYVRESLFRYLEDLEDYEIGVKALKNGSNVTYSGLAVDKKLAELREIRNKQAHV